MEEEKEDKLDFEIRPAIYSKSAVLWFSFLMTPVYGGVLLMMSLKTIDKRKEAATAFISSLLMTLTIYALSFYYENFTRAITFFLNLLCAFILTDVFYKKHIPDAAEYPKRSVLWPVIIAVAIMVILVGMIMLAFWIQDQGV